MPIDLRFDPNEIPLLTDLYELTMAASYFALGFNRPACFGMSVRHLPPRRGFLVAARRDRVRPLSFSSLGIVAIASGITSDVKLKHSLRPPEVPGAASPMAWLMLIANEQFRFADGLT